MGDGGGQAWELGDSQGRRGGLGWGPGELLGQLREAAVGPYVTPGPWAAGSVVWEQLEVLSR